MNIEQAMSRLWFQISLSSLKNIQKHQNGEHLGYNSILYLDLIYFVQPCTASALAELLNISKPGVTLKIKGLVEQGYVIKTPSQRDKRVNYLKVNEKNFTEYSLYREWMQEITKKASQNFTPDEISTFCKVINFITDKYQEA